MKKTNLTLAETNGAMEMMMARIFVEQNGKLSENDKKSLKHVVGLCKYLLDISEEVEEAECWANIFDFTEKITPEGWKAFAGHENKINKAMKNLTDFQEELYGSIF